jgi:hypothetical protein
MYPLPEPHVFYVVGIQVDTSPPRLHVPVHLSTLSSSEPTSRVLMIWRPWYPSQPLPSYSKAGGVQVSRSWSASTLLVQYNTDYVARTILRPHRHSSTMARRTLRERLRSFFSFFFRAESTTWPGETRSTAIKLLTLGIILALVQLSLSASMAHKLLTTRSEAECWEVDDGGGGYDENKSSLHVPGSFGFGLVMETKRLPLTFVNVDRLARKQGALGPEYLSAGIPGRLGGKWYVYSSSFLNSISHMVLFPTYMCLLLP